jgi:hypothetical protein
MLRDLRWVILLVGAVVCIGLILAVIGLFRKKSEKAKGCVKKLSDKMFFNGVIRLVSVYYIRIAMSTGKQAKLWAKGQAEFSLGSQKFAIFTCMFVILFPFIAMGTIHKKRDNLENPAVRLRFHNFYEDVKTKQRSWSHLMYYPVFLFRRIAFVLIPTALWWCNSFQIQLLISLSTLYIIFYGWVQPHWETNRTKLEIFNECILLAIAYHMIAFSDFNLDVDSSFFMGYSYIGHMLFMIVVNIIWMVIVTVQKWRRRRAHKQKMALVSVKLQLAEKIQEKIKEKNKSKKAKKSKTLGNLDDLKKGTRSSKGKTALDDLVNDEWDTTRVLVVDEKRYKKIMKMDKSKTQTLEEALKDLDLETSPTSPTSPGLSGYSNSSNSPLKNNRKAGKFGKKSHSSKKTV